MNIQAPIILKIELPDLDSNQGFQLQRLTCYRYTIGHRYYPTRKYSIGSMPLRWMDSIGYVNIDKRLTLYKLHVLR